MIPQFRQIDNENVKIILYNVVMEIIIQNMIYINIIILIAGVTSIHLGASFLKRERDTKGFFKFSVFLLALGNGLCCLGYSTMSLSTNLKMAYYFRVVGLIGIDIYLVAEIILVTSCLNFSKVAELLIIGLSSLAAMFDVIIYGHPDTDTFVRNETFTSYIRSDPYRHLFHYTYLAVLSICMLIIAIVWAFNVKYKREKQLVFFAFVSNFILAASSLPDVFKTEHDFPLAHIAYCTGIFLAFIVFYAAANNYMVFYITVASISRDIFSTLATGLLVFDTSYHLNLSNEYANKLLGLDKEPNRIRLKEIFHLKSGEPLSMFEKATEGIAIDYRLTSEVTNKVILVNFSCKMDRNNQPMCYILVATDLTEENRLIEDAQAANKAKSLFISNISHEIRTPINIISGMDELIRRECTDETILKYAENINIASRNLTSLINDVLDFSKIESGKLEIITSKYKVKNLLADLYTLFSKPAMDKNQTLSVVCDETLPSTLLGDDVRIKQILSNLLSNAVKYTPDEGNITIEVGYKKEGPSSIQLILKVRDTGIGIKEEDIPHIFENFQRLELSRNRTIEGTGLGLSITQNLVDLLHGTIQVESIYGKGSVFTVELPQAIADAKPIGNINLCHIAKISNYKSSFTAPKASVLAVDDVQMNLDVFVGLLKKTKISIDVALSGKEALSLLGQKKYDIVFLDHMMPEMDGIEVLNRLKADSSNPNLSTPVIMLTANATMGADKNYLENGFDDYLSKPIKPADLENMILNHLPDHKIILSTETEVAAASAVATSQSSFIEKLADILDVKAGLEFAAGDENFYKQILSTYIAEDKRPALNDFLSKEDWPNYQILAHSLKGTSLTIGASELSAAARELEFAVKENRLEYIKEHHSEVMKQYGELLEKLKVAI